MVYFITALPGNPPATSGHATTDETGYLWAISCATASPCFASGDYGMVVATTSGGTSWSQQSPGLFTDLNAISCPSASACVAVGVQGKALISTDSGNSWSGVQLPGAGYYTNMYGVSCPSTPVCFAVSDATYGSTDGGVTWSRQP